ncbi:MAG TPA: alpha/beta hydrolase [Acidobacteriota bacterium]|nr:alpha/beta hydrolase [Acidobacteriota bacterium]
MALSTKQGTMMQKTGCVISDGFQLQYIIDGEGLPTIVVGSALYYERTFSKHLRTQLKMAFLDHRGFAPGNHCTDLEKYRLEVLVDDIEVMRKALGFEQFVLIGHSGHTFMALEYAKKYPANVTHLVLMCSSPDFSEAGRTAADRYLEDSVCPERKAVLAANLARLPQAMAAAPNRAFVTYCLLMGPRNWFDFNFNATELWAGIEVNMPMFDYVWGEVFRDIDITKNLELVTMPVWLALGRYDYQVPPAYLWEPVREKFNNLTVRVFERSGHNPHCEEPALFDAELLGWILKNSD